jgi:tRNA(Ile)-lysidine synthase
LTAIVINSFKENMARLSVIPGKGKFLIGISGGVDSVVLTHLVHECQFNFILAHCNFLLREEESDGDEKFVEHLAKKLNIDCFVKKLETKKFARKKKISVQMAARELRYNWFRDLAEQQNCNYILTAHHQDDNLETVLLNFTRGTGINGLMGIPERNENILRPLLSFSRQEIINYAHTNKIEFREDSSNREEKYARNLLRNNVIPQLKRINPSLGQTSENNLTHFREVAQLKNEWWEEKKSSFGINNISSEKKISIAQLKQEKHLDLFLYEWLSEMGFHPHQVSSIKAMLSGDTGKFIQSASHNILKDRDFLVVRKTTNEKLYPEAEVNQFPFLFSVLNLRMDIFDNTSDAPEKQNGVVFFDYDLLKGKLLLRHWKKGDRFYPAGMTGSKKISDFFTSLKLNRFEKKEIYLLTCNNEIVWVAGHRSDRRFMVTEKTKRLLVIYSEQK